MPEPLYKCADTPCFFDANHAGNFVTWTLYICVFIYVTNAPFIWFSKKQNIVEISRFGSEFIAMLITRDPILELCYKLWMFGVTLDRLSDVMCDNQLVVNNRSVPQYNLVNKHNKVNYHVVQKAAVAVILRVGKEYTESNLDYLLKTILLWKNTIR